MAQQHTEAVSIAPLLKQLASPASLETISATEVSAAVALIFTNSLSPVQSALLLWALHTTGLDHKADVLAACASSMREAAAQVDRKALHEVVKRKRKALGSYRGGLCDIVGTGGDGHNTYNVSTTASIIASPLLMIAKHGNNSSTSLSGSADLLLNAPKAPVIAATNAATLVRIYEKTNYTFLYAREWHPGMKYAAPIRKEVPVRTIFNLLGPLANPVHDTDLVEARILGVAKQEMGRVFADALKLSGAKKAMVVCGKENMDELSCAGPTTCWRLHEEGGQVEIDEFTLSPEDFGLPRHPLSEVSGGKEPRENAQILMKILKNEMPNDDPVLQFVLLNTAALFAISGVCDAGASTSTADGGDVIEERGPGGLRWKEGIRRARWCIESGAALKEWDSFVDVTNELAN